MVSDTTTEEIVNNKTVRVNGEGQSPETTDGPITYHGCNAVGHVLESCPKDHGLTLTDFQMYQMKQTNASAKKKNPTSTGIDQLSSRFQKLAKEKNPPAFPTPPTPKVANDNDNTIPGPDTASQEAVEKTTPPAQTNTTPMTVQSDQTKTAKRLLSSLGIPTDPDTSRIKPSKEIPEKVPIKDTKMQQPVANVTGNAKSTKINTIDDAAKEKTNQFRRQ